jgi:FtsZ-binding cell division protein ZapB
MNRIEQLDKEIEELQGKINDLVQELGPKIEEREELKQKQWMEEHPITQDDVQLGACFGMPTFHHVGDLIRWMKERPDPKKYFEWNGKVYELEKGMEGMQKSLCAYDELPEAVS